MDDLRRIRIPQGEIEYRDVGSGPPLLFIHGLLADGELWSKVVPPLVATGHRCIVPTWPLGSHRIAMDPRADVSPPGVVEMVLATIDALDLRDVTLVGNDSGGAIAQMVCARRPARVGGLVLTNCDAFEVFPPPQYRYLLWLGRIPGLALVMAQAMLRIARLRQLRIAYGGLSRRPLPADLLRRWIEPSARQRAVRRDLRAFIRGVSPQLTLDAAAALARDHRPTLLAWGSADPVLPIGLAERLAAAIPGARLERIDDAGTLVAQDQPEALAAAIARWHRGRGERLPHSTTAQAQ